MRDWLNYWRGVRDRVTWDRSLVRGGWAVPLLFMRLRRNRPQARGTIAFHPQPAGPWYTLPLALASTGIRTTRNLSEADAVMIFDDHTHTQLNLPAMPAKQLNARATDISKVEVGRIFESVFGYPMSLDPQTHDGPMVEKSDVNGVHDGRIVEGPLKDEASGCAYQRLVDNTVRDGVTEDLRCVCVGGAVAQLFRKEKTTANRFRTSYLETTLQDTDTFLSAEEQTKIAEFCETIGLDFGSIDVLRDHDGDGRIYIVDVNKTCMPVLSMPVGELEVGLRRIGRAAEALILSPDA